VAQFSGMVIEMCRMYQGQKEAIDILKRMREANVSRNMCYQFDKIKISAQGTGILVLSA
jgi:hypothetical protein